MPSAAELVDIQVAVIVTSTPAAQAAKAATATVPIVFTTGGDPIKLGQIATLNRPGGNVTGVSNLITELGSKRLGLLRELVPSITLIATLINPNFPDAESQLRDAEAAARALGLQHIVLRAGSEREIDTAFAVRSMSASTRSSQRAAIRSLRSPRAMRLRQSIRCVISRSRAGS